MYIVAHQKPGGTMYHISTRTKKVDLDQLRKVLLFSTSFNCHAYLDCRSEKR